jgi:hypothetical protein
MRMTRPGHDAVARVDFSDLADGDVPGLGLGDSQFSFQRGRIGDTAQIRAGADLGADFDRHHLEDTVHPGLDLQVFELVDAQFVRRLPLIDFGRLRCELRLHSCARNLHSFPFDFQPVLQLVGRRARPFQLQLGDETVFEQLLVGLERQRRVLVLRFDVGDARFLVQQLAFQFGFAVGKVGLCRGPCQFRLHDRLHQVGVAELEDDRIRFDDRARPEHDALDAPLGRRRDPSNVFRNQRARAAHLTDHVAALHGVDPDGRAIHTWRRGLQPRHANGNENDGEQTHARVNGAADLLLFLDACRTCDINHCVPLS